MKKLLLVVLMLLLVTSVVFAKEIVDKQKVSKEAMRVKIDPSVVRSDAPPKLAKIQAATSDYGPGTFLMNSGYDYQNNGNMQRNIINYGDGTLAVARMAASQENLADRGSWWAFFDGSSWSEMVKVEGLRRGWTDTDILSDGRQVVVSHVANEVNIDALAGYGLWTSYLTGFIDDAGIPDHVWPRVGVDGMDNIHIMSATDTKAPGALYGDYYPIYTWSNDQGLTWNHGFIFGDPYTELDTTNGQWQGFNIDNYPVQCWGDNKVATMNVPRMDTDVADIWIAESEDNGQNWATQNLTNNPRLPALGDTLFAPSQGVDLAYDNDGNLHVIATHYMVLLDSAGTAADVFHSLTAPMRHWSEATGWVDMMTYEDLPGQDPFESIFDAGALSTVNDAGAGNNTTLKSPSIGFDADNNMYVTFCTPAPGDTLPDGTNMFDVYAVGSADGGKTWGPPTNITNPDGSNPAMEDADASLALLVDDYLHIVYNSDPQFGNNTDSGAEPFRTNMMYYAFPKSEISLIAVSVKANEPAMVPGSFELHQNYPNPFNPTTTLNFDLVKDAQINLSVYDVTGRLVTTLVDKKMQAGFHTLTWDAQNIASGVYFAKLVSANQTAVKKMTLIR